MTSAGLRPSQWCSWTDLVYGCVSRGALGMVFRLRLPFRDETLDPPAPGQFDHEWLVSRGELELAEHQGRSDSLLLERRADEALQFMQTIERALRQGRSTLVRVGRDLVLRRIGRDPLSRNGGG